jgi:hypothetical protein
LRIRSDVQWAGEFVELTRVLSEGEKEEETDGQAGPPRAELCLSLGKPAYDLSGHSHQHGGTSALVRGVC